VLALVVTLMVLLPEPLVIEVGLNVAAAFEGRPVALKLTFPAKPPDGVTVTV
jgi:hypothetical protein